MKNNLVNNISKSRSALIEITIIAVVLAICAGISAALIYERYKSSPGLLIALSVVGILACIVVLGKKILQSKEVRVELETFFVVNPKENTLVNIPRFHYGEHLYDFVQGAFKENSALKRPWDKEPIASGFRFDENRSTGTYKKSAAAKIIVEATEYYIIDILSTHLTDYFNQEKYSKSELKEYSRNDVPDILLSNRFMELFTTSMDKRSSFEHEQSSHGEVVMAYGKDGAIYHRFDLILPNESVVTRDDTGSINIDTKYFIFSFNVEFDESGFVSPRGFEKYYLGIDSYEKSSEYKVRVAMSVKFKMISYVKRGSWDYYTWLDSFLETIEENMSAEHFFNEIQWRAAYTLIQCGQVAKNA